MAKPVIVYNNVLNGPNVYFEFWPVASILLVLEITFVQEKG